MAALVAGCSSIPDFKPSKPLEEASSLNEALDLCAAYQIKGDSYETGRAKLARTVVIVPWINCFESLFRKFPVARNHEEYVMFFRNLQTRHDGRLASTEGTVDWPQLNYVVAQVIEHVKNPQLVYAEQELRAIEHELPDFWIWLAESGRFQRARTSGEVRASGLSDLHEEIEGKAPRSRDDAKTLPPRALPLTPEQREYCKRYVNYRSLLYNVEELADYKRVLEQHTYNDVTNANERTMRERVGSRFAQLKKEAIAQRAELDKDFARLQAKSSWFRNGYCLESKSLIRKKN